MSHPAPAPASPWAPLRRPVFRALWAAQLASNVGGWMQSVGAQWFLVEKTHSPVLVSLVQSASLIPVLVLSLVAGVLADALDRRRLLLVTTAASAVAAAVLVVLDVAGVLQPWSLLGVTLVLGCLTALTSPAWQAIQPELVAREEIPAAASLGSVTVNAARAVGPAVAGVIVGLTGPWAVFALNALSFLGVLVVVYRWKRPQRPAPLGRERYGEALLAGVRYVRAAPGVRRILLRAALFAIPACALWALLPTVAVDTLGLGSGGYGLLLGVLGIGAVAGVVVLPVLRRRLSSSWLLAGSAVVYAIGMAAPALGSVWPLIPVFLFTGLSWIVTLTTLNAALQLTLADWVRARGVAFYLLVFMGGQGVAALVWGVAADRIGSAETLLIAAGLLVLSGLSVVWLPLREGTGTLDRTITALSSGQPELVFEPDPADGPVTIEIDYRVRAGEAPAFLAAMKAVERSRRRTGATAWTLERSGEDDHAFREQFAARSWGEFTRAGLTRWTAYDHEMLDAALTHLENPPRERHFFPAEMSYPSQAAPSGPATATV